MAKKLILFFFLMAQFFSTHCEAFCLFDLNCPFPQGFYVGGLGGYNGGYDLNCDVKTTRGYYFGIKGGKKIFSIFRIEEEVTWQRNNVNSISGGRVQLDHVRGHVDIWSFMANALLDINCDFLVRPFIGGGVGYAHINGHWKGKVIQTNGDFVIIKKHFRSNLNKGDFAWQVIAGLKYFICPSLEASIEYRFFKINCPLNNHKLGLALTKIF